MGRLLERRLRRPNGIQWRLHKPEWVDPTPWIPKTHAEALVFDALQRRGIFFKFQVMITDLIPAVKGAPVLAMSPYRADFAIPGPNIILDPWDDYHHSLPDQAKADTVKLAVYQALGWKTYHVWSSDLERNGPEWWLSTIPELTSPLIRYGAPEILDVKDDTAGIASANAARRKFKSPTLKRRGRRGRRQLT